ncbi:Ger(x)C family spore germination protein [Neobacillus sp. BF23-41]|uniref:Ger(x)C family spore germination protein n=1 Tax=Neobacillus sp. BF23-41 TaxID=3240280 RepID=UPI0034E3814B
MIRIIIFLLASCLTLSACTQKKIVDQIALPIVMGIDNTKNHKLQYTIAVPIFQSNQSVLNTTYTFSDYTLKNSHQMLQTENSKPITTSKISVVLCGKDLAKDGLMRSMDTILRDPKMSRKIFLAIVDGQAKDLLESDFSSNEEKGIFLNQMIKGNIQNGYLPETHLHQFEYALLGEGMDPYLPLFKKYKEHTKKNKERIKISGLALFRKNQYVTTLPLKQMPVFRLMVDDANNGIHQVKMKNHSYAAVRNQGSKVRYEIKGSSKKPGITINLTLNGTVTEYSGFNLTEKNRLYLERSFEKQITNTGKSLLHTFQKLQIDPLQIGDFVRSQTRDWEAHKWHQNYPDVPIHLNVDVHIQEIGATQ